MQMFDLASLTFNGVSLFATKDDSGNNLTFDNLNQLPGQRYTEVVNVSADGTSGPQVSINKALFLAALTIDASDIGTGQSFDSAGANQNVDSNIAFAASDNTEADALDLWDISVGVFQQAIENIATLRADNGGTMSRLRFAADDVALQKTNLIAANGRIKDVDIATESTNLAKYQVLVQASASMLAQANSNADIAMMLLR
jgi:flagellin-like hook-associated protein FlgL